MSSPSKPLGGKKKKSSTTSPPQPPPTPTQTSWFSAANSARAVLSLFAAAKSRTSVPPPVEESSHHSSRYEEKISEHLEKAKEAEKMREKASTASAAMGSKTPTVQQNKKTTQGQPHSQGQPHNQGQRHSQGQSQRISSPPPPHPIGGHAQTSSRPAKPMPAVGQENPKTGEKSEALQAKQLTPTPSPKEGSQTSINPHQSSSIQSQGSQGMATLPIITMTNSEKTVSEIIYIASPANSSWWPTLPSWKFWEHHKRCHLFPGDPTSKTDETPPTEDFEQRLVYIQLSHILITLLIAFLNSLILWTIFIIPEHLACAEVTKDIFLTRARDTWYFFQIWIPVMVSFLVMIWGVALFQYDRESQWGWFGKGRWFLMAFLELYLLSCCGYLGFEMWTVDGRVEELLKKDFESGKLIVLSESQEYLRCCGVHSYKEYSKLASIKEDEWYGNLCKNTIFAANSPKACATPPSCWVKKSGSGPHEKDRWRDIHTASCLKVEDQCVYGILGTFLFVLLLVIVWSSGAYIYLYLLMRHAAIWKVGLQPNFKFEQCL